MLEIHHVKLCDNHPIWPGDALYKIYDKERKRYRLGSYTTKKAAGAVVEKLSVSKSKEATS